LSKQAIEQLNSEILRQFEDQGLIINDGVAVDARLVKSASRPLSNDQLKEVREHRNTPVGKLDENGNVRKFSRDINSNWFMQNDEL
jgi:IS5 family transposase